MLKYSEKRGQISMKSTIIDSIQRDENGRIILGYMPASVKKADELNGKRKKFWYEFDDTRVLFKVSSPNTFEDYAELLAEELSNQIGLPTAHYDLAIENGQPGVISYDFREGGFFNSGSLILKNYINISRVNSGQKPTDTFKNNEYNNLQTIEKALSLECSPEQVSRIMENLDLLYGLDCISLQADRHWNNWGIVTRVDSSGRIEKDFAPQFDGSALCRFVASKRNIEKRGHYLFMQSRLPQIKRIIENDLWTKDFDTSFTLRYDEDIDRDYIGVSRLMKAYEDNPLRFGKVIDRLSQINTFDAISRVEERIGARIPEECSLWFHSIVSNNIKLMEEERKEIDESKGISQETVSESRGKAK